MGIGVDHIGIYVADLEHALDFYCGKLGLERPEIDEKPEHRMRIARLRCGDVELELIEAAVEDTMLRHMPHKGPGIYHIGLRVDSTDQEVERLRASGVKLLDETPREGDAMRVAFLDPSSADGVMIELVERLGRDRR